MNEETDTMAEATTSNIFNDYLKLQKKYDLLKTDYDTLQSKSSAALMEWDSHTTVLRSLQRVVNALGEVLNEEIDRKNG